MSQHDSTIRKPRTDDRPLWDLQYGGAAIFGSGVIGDAHRAGFTDIEVKPTWGYWSIVTGRRP